MLDLKRIKIYWWSVKTVLQGVGIGYRMHTVTHKYYRDSRYNAKWKIYHVKIDLSKHVSEVLICK